MRVMSNNDYKLFERLVSLRQNSVRKSMAEYLKSKYDNVIITNRYLVAIGEIPVALVAHMDTVFETPVSNLYYDQRKGVMWSPEGLGADDRAGIFAIIKIIQSGLRPSIIFTTDEEKGGIGACALAISEFPFEDLKYLIELDRRGINDCVFYECYCPEFVSYIESFGFKEAQGSFSDISFLMPEWDICGVNLSIGYEDEHSTSEILHVDAMYNTIDKVKRMLQETEIPDFKYDENPISRAMWWRASDVYGQHCSKCKKLFSEYELMPVKSIDDVKYYCPDCIVGAVEWCEECGEPFENPTGTAKICNECLEDLCRR